jgi:eukaryotic-like serine/threonine-protein kinase
MDRSRPIDPDATEPMPAGQFPADGSTCVGASALGLPETVVDDGVIRGENATVRIEPADPDGRKISPPLEDTEPLRDDRRTLCRDAAGTPLCADLTVQDLDATLDLDGTVAGAVGPILGLPGDSGWMGRYHAERRLGGGTFGEVFLAYDGELKRWVAIKVPYSSQIADPEDFEDFVYEARILAGLDHEAIVPVYDIGRMPDGRCFIVSKYIDGCSLDHRLREDRPPSRLVAAWIATAAEALHFAHACSVIHRDVKPANILLDRAGHLFVADFGLARRAGDLEDARGFYGTPAYASPEQARREGHRVDGRSDVFSLGVVFYEALTGEHPFRRATLDETLGRILEHTPRPLRELDGTIPAELERICLKAMAKRSDDRYESASAMAADLRHWLDQADAPGAAAAREGSSGRSLAPRGLRSYEGADSDAFLDLVPGPRGRDGLPECLGFWKRRIESAEDTGPFPVGVIYGPTGSGKSSLVRAGLIPRLADSVSCVYVESTIEGTERRLLRGLHGRFPGLAGHEDLAGLLRELRQERGPAGPGKVLIVLDQFEQWLFGQRAGGRRALEDALRQCDGERVQALLLVRDDFWMDLTRFFRGLEVGLMDGWNAAAVDLFDRDHARKVLIALGRAHGRLPADPAALGPEHRAFLDRALEALAQDGRVVCVRLVLLAELLRSKPWVPATLAELGGARTIGVMILDEAFSAPQAPPQNRTHRLAAQEVLKRLLPEGGVLIKGHMSSRSTLMDASGYSALPREFQELMWILDHELRLVTPADPLGRVEGGDVPAADPGPQYYQLTHDYLIPDLREWLFRDRQKSLRGRAELRLQEFASVWSERHKDKFLPSAWEWAALRLLTDRRRWSPVQRSMMRAAAGRHARGALAVLAMVAFIGLSVFWMYAEIRARSLVEGLKSADIGQVLRISREIGPFRRWALPLLRSGAATEQQDPRARLRCSMALLPDDPGRVDYLVGRMLAEDPVTSLTIREALYPFRGAIAAGLWEAAKDSRRPAPDRLRAALALCLYDPPPDGPPRGAGPRAWDEIAGSTADALVTTLDANPAVYATLLEAVQPIRSRLIPRLKEYFLRPNDDRRALATSLLVDLARDDPEVVADLALESDDRQFLKIYPFLGRHRMRLVSKLQAEASRPSASPAPGERDHVVRRRAIAAMALLRLGEGGDAWAIFRNEPDPNARTFVIHNAARYGLSLATLVDRLEVEQDPSCIRGLLFAIGQHGALRESASESRLAATLIRDRFLGHGDAGIHGAAEWLLMALGGAVDGAPLDPARVSTRRPGSRNWYPTKEGHTMVIIDARHVPGINRVFAIASKETTVEQMLHFNPSHYYKKEDTVDPTCPVGVVTWAEAIDYCEWLDGPEGIPASGACYPHGGDRLASPLPLPDLTKRGYRLPTRDEWEFASLAGATTLRHYGDDDRLLDRYALFRRPRTANLLQPVGRLLPNDFGLFDVYGSVEEWNADVHKDGKQVLASGGSYHNLPEGCDSRRRDPTLPGLQYDRYGFRIARTIELDEKGEPKSF